jgi:hypothetical protein
MIGTFLKGTYTMNTKQQNNSLNVEAKDVLVEGVALWTKEHIKQDQDTIRVSLVKLDQAVHTNAVQCLLHAEKHGDTSLMRRLLIEVLDDKTGYRRQGLINWMRKHSPMELKGDIINLSGVDQNGNKREFKLDLADKTPFWTDKDNAERVVKPVYRDNLMSKINSSLREFKAAMANTLNGQPIDPTKPHYDGIHADKVVDFFEQVEKLANALPADQTKTVRTAQQTLREAIGDDKEAKDLMLKAVG